MARMILATFMVAVVILGVMSTVASAAQASPSRHPLTQHQRIVKLRADRNYWEECYRLHKPNCN